MRAQGNKGRKQQQETLQKLHRYLEATLNDNGSMKEAGKKYKVF